MAQRGIEEGQEVLIRTTAGEVRVPAQSGELPAGMLFMPMGPNGQSPHRRGNQWQRDASVQRRGSRGGGIMKTTIENVVCTFCGCLCDDLVVEVEDEQIVKVKKGVWQWQGAFLNTMTQLPSRRPLMEKRSVGTRPLPRRCGYSRRPIARSSMGLVPPPARPSAAQWRLADKLGAMIDTTSSVCHGPTGLAMQTVGEPTCTLGEVRNRADLVLFWGCNPAAAHLRHFARYSVLAKGKLTPGGRRDRTVVVVDVRATPSTKLADIILQVEPGRDFEVLTTLRALVKGKTIIADQVGGVPVSQLETLVSKMKSCRFGVVHMGMGLTQTCGPRHQCERAFHPGRRNERVHALCGYPHARAR